MHFETISLHTGFNYAILLFFSVNQRKNVFLSFSVSSNTNLSLFAYGVKTKKGDLN